MAIAALACHRLGREADARKRLASLRALAGDDEEARGLVGEATKLIESGDDR